LHRRTLTKNSFVGAEASSFRLRATIMVKIVRLVKTRVAIFRVTRNLKVYFRLAFILSESPTIMVNEAQPPRMNLPLSRYF
jgi:hypothetical protein